MHSQTQMSPLSGPIWLLLLLLPAPLASAGAGLTLERWTVDTGPKTREKIGRLLNRIFI
jgi:hypothetical protein